MGNISKLPLALGLGLLTTVGICEVREPLDNTETSQISKPVKKGVDGILNVVESDEAQPPKKIKKFDVDELIIGARNGDASSIDKLFRHYFDLSRTDQLELTSKLNSTGNRSLSTGINLRNIISRLTFAGFNTGGDEKQLVSLCDKFIIQVTSLIYGDGNLFDPILVLAADFKSEEEFINYMQRIIDYMNAHPNTDPSRTQYEDREVQMDIRRIDELLKQRRSK